MTGGGSISLFAGYEFEEKYQLSTKTDNYGKTSNMTTTHTVNALISSYTHTNHKNNKSITRDAKFVIGAKAAFLLGLEVKVTFGTK